MLWVRRAHLCRAGQKDGTAGRAACCFCAKWGKGARPNRQAPLSFLEDGAKGRRAKRPPEQAGAPCHFLGRRKKAGGKSARPNGQAPLSFLEDGTKGGREKRPPEQAGPLSFLGAVQKGRKEKRSPVPFPSGMFIHPFNGLFRARPGDGQPVSDFSCGASGPGPARQTADKPPARAQTPPRRSRRLSAGTSAYPAHS